MNDSLRTNVFVRFQVETIACACIFLAARALQVVARFTLSCRDFVMLRWEHSSDVFNVTLTVSSHQKCTVFPPPLARRVAFAARGRLVDRSSDFVLLSPIPSLHNTATLFLF